MKVVYTKRLRGWRTHSRTDYMTNTLTDFAAKRQLCNAMPPCSVCAWNEGGEHGVSEHAGGVRLLSAVCIVLHMASHARPTIQCALMIAMLAESSMPDQRSAARA